MRRRILSLLLAGSMLLSQCMVVPAADLPDTGVGLTVDAEEEETPEDQALEEAAEEAAVLDEDAAQPSEEEPAAEPVIEEDEPAEEETAAPEEAAGDESAQPEEDTDIPEAAEESPAPVTEEVEAPVAEEAEAPAAEEALPAARPDEEAPAAEETADPGLRVLSDYSFNLDRSGSGELFQDSTGDYIWSAPIVAESDDTTGWVYQAEVTEHDGDDNADLSQAVYIENDNLYIDGAILTACNVVNFTVGITLYVDGILIDSFSAEYYFTVSPASVEISWEDQAVTLLPQWWHHLERFHQCHVMNGQYPHGEDLEVEITDVAIDNEDIVSLEYSDDNGYDLCARNYGTAHVTVTYTDWDGTPGLTADFEINVCGDFYNVGIQPADNVYETLPGNSIHLTAVPSREVYDPDEDYHYTLWGDDVTGASYNWSFTILGPGQEELSTCVSLEPDSDDTAHADLIFGELPEDYSHVDVLVNVTLSIDGEVKAETGNTFSVSNDYYELWPDSLDAELPIGGEYVFDPELRHYTYDLGGYEELSDGVCMFLVTADDPNVAEVTDNGDGTYTIRRSGDGDLTFQCDAYSLDEDSDYIFRMGRRYSIRSHEYTIDVAQWESGPLYDDSVWSCPIYVNGFDGDYILFARAEDADDPGSTFGESEIWVDNDAGRLYIDGADLKDRNIRGINVHVGAEIGGTEIDACWDGFIALRESFVDRRFNFGDADLLPGWDYRLDKYHGGYVENSQYPEGYDFNIEVTDVSIADTNVVRIENSDENGWNLKAGNTFGSTTVTVTFFDWDGSTQTTDFNLSVGSDVYEVNLWHAGGTHRTLPGGTVNLEAQARHQSFDPATGEQHEDSEEELAGISYQWEFYITNDDARHELEGVIVCSQADNDPRKASVHFPDMAYPWENIEVDVRVSIFENGQLLATNLVNVTMSTNYLELWPRNLENSDMAVGEECILRPELRRYDCEQDDYTVIAPENASFQLEIYNDRAYEITEIDQDGSLAYRIRRLNGDNASFRIKAFARAGEDYFMEVDNVEYWLNEQHFNFRYDIEGNDDIFDDGARTFGFWLDELGGLDFELRPEVGTGEWDPENGFEMPAPEGICWTFDANANTITFYGEALRNAGFDHINTRVALLVGGSEVADEWHGFNVREARTDYWFNCGDDDLLPGWDYHVDRMINCRVENSQFPDGQDFHLEATDISIENEGLIHITGSDEGGWHLKANDSLPDNTPGQTDVTLTFTDWDGSEQTRTFTLRVGTDVYYIDYWFESPSHRTLPGGTVTMMTQARHESYDPETGDYHDYSNEELAGISYDWDFTITDENARADLEDVIECRQDENDPRRASVHFPDIDYEWDWIDVEARVTISENGHALASESRNVSMARHYLELYPRQLENSDLAVGEELILRPELRVYDCDEDDYTVLSRDFVRFETEIYNDRAYELTEIEENGQIAFRVRRLNGDNASFRIRAYELRDNGEEEEVDDVEYWLNGQDFDFGYDIEGADEIFSDGSRTFGFWLDGLNGLDFQLVPEVGLGEWDEENGFETPLAPGTYWTFDGNANTITFDGAALYAAGIGNVNTRIALLIGGVEVEDEWHDFDVWESEYWYPGEFEDQTLLVGDYRFVPSFGSINVRNNDHPDGENVPFSVTNLDVTYSDHPFDTRDTLSTRVDDGGMEVRAVRWGEAYFTATIHVDDIDLTREFTYFVSGERYTLNLQTSTHSDRMTFPGTLTITPQIFAEAIDPETGWHYDMGTEGLKVIYEVSCNNLNWDAVSNLGLDPVYAMGKGLFWDYTLDEAANSLTIKTLNSAGDLGFLELEVRAFLIDTETGETLTETGRNISSGIFYQHLTFLDEQGEVVDWNEDLLPGERFTVTPQLMVSNPGGDDPIENFDTSNTRYQIGFYPGSGDEWDPPHLRVWDKDGNEILSDQEVTPDAFPLTIQRQVEWSFGLSVRAVWTENDGGFDNDLYSDYYCNDFSTEAGFTAHDAANADEYEATYYYYQPIHVTTDLSKLNALKAVYPDLTVTTEAGIYDFDNREMRPILLYEPDETGYRGDPLGEYPIGTYLDVNAGTLTFTEAQLPQQEAFQELLAYQNDAYGRQRPYFNLRVLAQMNGVTVYENVYTVNIISDTYQLSDYVHEMGVGQTHVVPAENSLFVNKLGYDGDYGITITDIRFVNDNDSQYLSISKNADGDWLLTALRFSDMKYIPLEAEFTDNSITNGAPVRLYVIISESLITYDLDYDSSMNGIKEIVIGGSYTFTPDVKRHIFNEGDEEIVQEVLPRGSVTGGYSYDIEFYDYNQDILTVDSATGTITGRDEGSTNLTVDVCVYDEHSELCDRFSFDLTVYVRIFIEELTVKENPSFELVTGISYTAKALADRVNPIFRIYSMKHPEGEEYPIESYHICDFNVDDVTPTLTETGDGEYSRIKIALSETTVKKSGMMILRAKTAEGFQSEVFVPVTVNPATIKLAATSGSIVKTKYKNVRVYFQADDSIYKVSTSNSAVATAAINGNYVKITAGKTMGKATITVKLKSGKYTRYTVTVPKYNCTGITAKSSYTVTTLSTIDLGVKLKPVYSDNKITYKSANKKIATVTSKGVVKGVKVGKTKITITTDNKIKKTVTIVVKQGTTGLTTDKTTYSVKKGKTVTIKATKTPSTSADKITFTSSNTKVATVTSKGVVKGVKKGTTYVTVKSGTKSKKVKIVVK